VAVKEWIGEEKEKVPALQVRFPYDRIDTYPGESRS
jgi:hypothetical protein